MNRYKAMKIPDGIFKTNKKSFVAVHPKNPYKPEFSDNLWPAFLDQPQSYVVVFEIISFRIYIILVIKWEHVKVPNDIIKLNEE